MCAAKGPKDAVAACACLIWELGHARLIIQSDPEPAILAMVSAVRDMVVADGKADFQMSGYTEGFTRVQLRCRTHRATGERYGAGLPTPCTWEIRF